MKMSKMQVFFIFAVAFSVTVNVALSNPLPDADDSNEYYDYYGEGHPEEHVEEHGNPEAAAPPESSAEISDVVPEVLPEEGAHDTFDMSEESDEYDHHDHHGDHQEVAVPIKADISPFEEEEPQIPNISGSPEAESEPKAKVDMEIDLEAKAILPVVIKAEVLNITDSETQATTDGLIPESQKGLEKVVVGIMEAENTSETTTIRTSTIPTHLAPPTSPSSSTLVDTTQFTDELHLDKTCTQPPVTGMCRGSFPMFYFDHITRTCKQFVYGGCLGNKNVHKTAADCYTKCYPQGLKGLDAGKSRGLSQSNYLTVRGGTGASTLTFTGKDASAKVDPAVLSDFTIEDVYAFEFHFKTDSPHGLIAFLRQVSVPEDMEGTRVQFYIYLKKGHLAVTHVYDNRTETFVMKRGGLQALNWHSATVQIDSNNGKMVLDVDGFQEYLTIESLSLQPHYGRGQSRGGFASVLWVGGVFGDDVKREDMTLGFVPFHGCLEQLTLSSGPVSQEMVGVKPLVATMHTGVKEHCSNNCNDRYKNLCSRKSHCVEHFDRTTCNCFRSNQDGPRCTNPAIPVLSLNGDGYVVHRLYEWMDRVHSYSNLISVEFKTRFTDSILLYASSEDPERQYIAASITRTGSIYVEVNLGGGAVSSEVGENMNAEIWYTLSIVHQHEKISLYIDNTRHAILDVPGSYRYLHVDPEFYLGNTPYLSRVCGLPLDIGWCDLNSSNAGASYQYYYDKSMGICQAFHYIGCGGSIANRFPDEASCMSSCYVPGLRSLNPYMGCMRNVFFNDISILQSLRENNKGTKYFGSTKEAILGTKCNDTKFISLTFSTERAAMSLMNPEPLQFHLILSFRPTLPKGVLASGEVDLIRYESVSQWELRHDTKHVYFYIHDNLLVLKSDAKISIGNWHYVEIHYKSGRMNMMVNNQKQGKEGPGKLIFSPKVTVGMNILDEYPGFVGCIRKLTIGQTKLDLRTTVGTPMVNQDVTYDNCQVLGPCEGPKACEHGGKCTIDGEGEVQCDCSGTGYTGNKCHFSLYKRSCEQYRQMGLDSSGIYHIDIDGNGPLPPAYVKCSFSSLVGETYTTIEHNVEEQYEVRRQGLKDFQLDVQYRDFSADMLKTLIAQSKSCSQEIDYQCRRAPLRMSDKTWFKSPAKNFITNFATRSSAQCRCKELGSCERDDVVCNCDINDGILRRDKGVITEPEQLPITSMVFLQGEEQKEDSEAHLTLKPLICITKASKEHAVSFTEKSSYLEVPGWREGSFSLTFRTTSDKAIVAYQPSNHSRHATFMISLVGARDLEFMYRYRGQIHQHVHRSTKSLNDGRWQQVLVDVYNHQLRFVINSEEKFIDMDLSAYLGVLDGSMFLGGIPEHSKAAKGEDIENLKLGGLIGCIRGLTLNEEVVDLERYMGYSFNGVSIGCTQSCDPNPCQNGAKCVEMWGNYKCECANPLAHSGRNCETNINQDAITFTTTDSKYKYFDNDTSHSGEKLFNETFFINFRTHSRSGLILFAYNHLHNFVQLHLASEKEVVFMFNNGNEVKTISATATEGVVFNSGQSVQIKVLRSNTSTSLNVFTKGSLFEETMDIGVLLLQEDDYQQFPFGESQPLPEMVYYPHSMTKPWPFFLAYLGSANDKQHDISCSIPGIVGCLRGLKIGQRLLPLDKMLEKSPYSTEGIVSHCNMMCDQNPCLNGGVCTENFQFRNNFLCDCAETSYTGATCNTETAYTFNGRQWISQDSSVAPLDGDLKFEVAFSTSNPYSRKQAVALLRSTNPSSLHDYLLVWVGPEGSIMVEAQLHQLDEDQVHGAQVTPSDDAIDAFDGLRHYVVVEKKEASWSVKIDGDERDIKEVRSVFISETPVKATPTSLYIGGLETGLDDRLIDYHNFHGCVSNLRISTSEGVSNPLRQYSEGDLHLHNNGFPGQGRCAGFTSYPTMMLMMPWANNDMKMSPVMGSDWAYRRPEKIPLQTSYLANTHPERDTAFDNVVPTVAGIVFAIAIVIVVVLLLKTYIKKKRQAKTSKDEDKKPLFNGQYKPRSNTVIMTSEKNESVPLLSAPDGIPKSSSADVPKEVKKLDKPSDIALEDIKPVSQSPAVKEDEEVQDVPELPSPPEAVTDGNKEEEQEDAQVHRDGTAGESEDEVQVRRSISNNEEGEITAGRPLSWDKSTDNLPLIIGHQDGIAVGATSGGDTSSESSIDITIDINVTPPSSPTSNSVPESSGGAEIDPPPKIPNNFDEDTRADSDSNSDSDSDPEPVLMKHVPLPERTEFDDSKLSEKPLNKEPEVDSKPEAENDSEGSANEESKPEAETEATEIDFSKVPVIKIERSQSEDDGDEIVVVDDDPEEEKEEVSIKEAEKEEPELKAAEKEEPELKAAEKEEPELKAVEKEEPELKAAEKEEPELKAVEKEEPELKAAEKEEPELKAAEKEEPELEAAEKEEPELKGAEKEEPEPKEKEQVTEAKEDDSTEAMQTEATAEDDQNVLETEEDKTKVKEDDDEFINFRNENVKVEDAERMSKPI